ncbi:protein of unknown function [Cognatiyoonia koreensis]|uniref:DUF4166 domain-containing protein n=1 Tax=Cognatiyoonia koreensis TaxID=364200 RepID=A0A1I0RWX3_9RHOB|nr:DUF4166 domain-containing protein [Cognatiyoonia koreensis]SEW46047.1 protein of unknown function [Cognatiyoonia koreensis]
MLMKQVFEDDAPASDCRFRKLLGEAGWHRLPAAVRRRFGKRLKGGVSVAYQGKVVAMQMNLAGRLLAQAARLIGAPLPYDLSSKGQPAVVIVTEDIASDGQFWVRQYGRAKGFPQVVHSSKRFAGPSGLEEYIGYGIGMALKIVAEDDALLFKSDHYFVQVFGRKFRLPRFLSPGALVIGHHDLGEHNFMFSLRLHNRLFGELIAQDCLFQDAKE